MMSKESCISPVCDSRLVSPEQPLYLATSVHTSSAAARARDAFSFARSSASVQALSLQTSKRRRRFSHNEGANLPRLFLYICLN